MPKDSSRQDVNLYVDFCTKEHKRREELFDQRWVGADNFHEYLITIEPYSEVLNSEMAKVVEAYFERGRDYFRDCDHRSEDAENRRFSELVTKYVIEEGGQKIGFAVGILELIRVHPFEIAQRLRVSRKCAVGDLNMLPQCLAFNGGIYLIPETEEWEPMSVLWRMWKGSTERLPNQDLIAEHVTLIYRSPSHIDREHAMASLLVDPIMATKVMVILRKVIRDFAQDVDGGPQEDRVQFYAEALFPSYSDSVYNFYLKNSRVELVQRGNPRKPIAARFPARSARSPNTMMRSLRSSIWLRNEPSTTSTSQHSYSTRLAANLRSSKVAISENPQITLCSDINSLVSLKPPQGPSDMKKLKDFRKLENIKDSVPESHSVVGSDEQKCERRTRQRCNVRDSRIPLISTAGENFSVRRERKVNNCEIMGDAEKLLIAASSVSPESQDFHTGSCVMENSVNSPVEVLSIPPCHHVSNSNGEIRPSINTSGSREKQGWKDSTCSTAGEAGLHRTGAVPKSEAESLSKLRNFRRQAAQTTSQSSPSTRSGKSTISSFYRISKKVEKFSVKDSESDAVKSKAKLPTPRR